MTTGSSVVDGILAGGTGATVIAGLTRLWINNFIADHRDLKRKVEDHLEKRVTKIEGDHDGQVALKASVDHLSETVSENMADIKRMLSGQDEILRAHDRTLASQGGDIANLRSRADGLHDSIVELRKGRAA